MTPCAEGTIFCSGTNIGKSNSKDNMLLLPTKGSEMYVAALLIFDILSLQFHPLLVAVHKLLDSLGEKNGLTLFPKSCMRGFLNF